MMQFLEQEILDITETTWQAMLGLPLRAAAWPATMEIREGYLTGRVEIDGAWKGTVLLHGSGQLAQAAASVIFANGDAPVTLQDRKDAMYELTNVIAGNIKSLLPECCHLSLPQVMETNPSSLTVLSAACVSQCVFECQGERFFVSLWKCEGMDSVPGVYDEHEPPGI